MTDSPSNPIILYDGVCGLCNRFVQFVLKHDAQQCFRFASLQSEFAIPVLRRHGAVPDDLDTMYVVLDYALPAERLAKQAEAATVILQGLGGWSVLGRILSWFPEWLRKWGYSVVARNRYRIFGKYDSCPFPNEKDRSRVLDL
jgi:predicted DCC family thiol-disulfide oxidoreductase YuxK